MNSPGNGASMRRNAPPSDYLASRYLARAAKQLRWYVVALIFCSGCYSSHNPALANARAAAEAHRWEAAIAYLDDVLLTNPHSTEALELRAKAHFETGNFEAAVRDLSSVEPTEDGLSRHGQILLARASLALGDTEESLAACNAALLDEPKDADVLLVRAQVYLTQRRDQAACDDAEQAIALRPGLAAAYVIRGQGHLALKDFRSAESDLTKAIGLDETNAKAFGLRGAVRNALGQDREAQADFDKAGELDPAWRVAGGAGQTLFEGVQKSQQLIEINSLTE